MHNGLTEQDRQTLAEMLHRTLADTYAVFLKTQNFHWNLTGSSFFQLHLLFEKQYEELFAAIDEIAERIRALGFFVEASFESFKRVSSIQEEDKVRSIADMLQVLVKDHETVARHLRQLGNAADAASDHATVDLVGRRLGAHEKFTWFLQSSLK